MNIIQAQITIISSLLLLYYLSFLLILEIKIESFLWVPTIIMGTVPSVPNG